MPNSIKDSGADGLALQVTQDARAAGLVEERADGTPAELATVRVFSFDDILLVVDRDALPTRNVAAIVATVTEETASIYRAMDASIQIAGNGYQVQLPPAEDAGFDRGDPAPVHAAPGMLVIANSDRARLAADVVAIRREQSV